VGTIPETTKPRVGRGFADSFRNGVSCFRPEVRVRQDDVRDGGGHDAAQ
jgi:hypothetical protein